MHKRMFSSTGSGIKMIICGNEHFFAKNREKRVYPEKTWELDIKKCLRYCIKQSQTKTIMKTILLSFTWKFAMGSFWWFDRAVDAGAPTSLFFSRPSERDGVQ